VLTKADPLTDRFSGGLVQYADALALGQVEPANLVIYYHAWSADQLLERLQRGDCGKVLIQRQLTTASVWAEEQQVRNLLESEIGGLCNTDFDRLLRKLPADYYWCVHLHDYVIQATPMRSSLPPGGIDTPMQSFFAECEGM
jgi:hypothetical protein